MILDLHRQGLTVSVIARELGVDRKTVRRCIARGLEPPVYGPRKPRKRLLDPFIRYLRERVMAYPGLTGRRLWRELGERGYQGGYTAVTDVLREIRPARFPAFEVRFVAKTKGKVERPYRYIREDFFLARSFRNLDDLNGQLRHWLDTVANPRVHATTQRVVNEAFAAEKPHLKSLPLAPFRSVLKLERRVSHEGMVSVGGNLYSVPDATRKRVVEVHTLADEVRIFEAGTLIAAHPVLEGRHQRRVAAGHRKTARIPDRRRHEPIRILRTGDVVAARPLEFYQAVGQRLACPGDQP